MSFIAKHLVYNPIQWLRREPVRKCMKELRASQFFSPERLTEWQCTLLKSTLVHAYRNIPYYKRIFQSVGLEPEGLMLPDDLATIPFLTKSHLRDHKIELTDSGYSGPIGSKTTGGSTGEAVTVIKDRVAMGYARGVMWRNYGWWGIEIGDRQGRFWGIPVTAQQRRRYQLIDLLSNRVRFSSFNFGDDDLFDYYCRLLRFRPRYLYGYASMIYEFAAFLGRKGLTFSVPLVVTTSEVLFPHQREIIQRVLNCKVANEYGCGEVGPIAFECPDGGMHLMADNLFVEVLGEDGTQAERGDIGQVVITELHSRAMPLVRYQVLDSVVMGDSRCSCGRGLPLIEKIVGRAYDYLVAKSGKRFHGEKVMYLLEHLQDQKMGVRNMQVVQDAFTKLTVNIHRDGNFQERATDVIRSYFLDALGSGLNIEFKFVDVIPRTPSGKFQVVVRKF